MTLTVPFQMVSETNGTSDQSPTSTSVPPYKPPVSPRMEKRHGQIFSDSVIISGKEKSSSTEDIRHGQSHAPPSFRSDNVSSVSAKSNDSVIINSTHSNNIHLQVDNASVNALFDKTDKLIQKTHQYLAQQKINNTEWNQLINKMGALTDTIPNGNGKREWNKFIKVPDAAKIFWTGKTSSWTESLYNPINILKKILPFNISSQGHRSDLRDAINRAYRDGYQSGHTGTLEHITKLSELIGEGKVTSTLDQSSHKEIVSALEKINVKAVDQHHAKKHGLNDTETKELKTVAQHAYLLGMFNAFKETNELDLAKKHVENKLNDSQLVESARKNPKEARLFIESSLSTIYADAQSYLDKDTNEKLREIHDKFLSGISPDTINQLNRSIASIVNKNTMKETDFTDFQGKESEFLKNCDAIVRMCFLKGLENADHTGSPLSLTKVAQSESIKNIQEDIYSNINTTTMRDENITEISNIGKAAYLKGLCHAWKENTQNALNHEAKVAGIEFTESNTALLGNIKLFTSFITEIQKDFPNVWNNKNKINDVYKFAKELCTKKSIEISEDLKKNPSLWKGTEHESTLSILLNTDHNVFEEKCNSIINQ